MSKNVCCFDTYFWLFFSIWNGWLICIFITMTFVTWRLSESGILVNISVQGFLVFYFRGKKPGPICGAATDDSTNYAALWFLQTLKGELLPIKNLISLWKQFILLSSAAIWLWKMAFTDVKSLGLCQDRKLICQKGMESRTNLGAPIQRTSTVLCAEISSSVTH